MLKHPGYGHKRVAAALQISRKRAQLVIKLYGLKPAQPARAPNNPHDMGQPESNRTDILSKLSPMAPDRYGLLTSLTSGFILVTCIWQRLWIALLEKFVTGHSKAYQI